MALDTGERACVYATSWASIFDGVCVAVLISAKDASSGESATNVPYRTEISQESISSRVLHRELRGQNLGGNPCGKHVSRTCMARIGTMKQVRNGRKTFDVSCQGGV